jgi:sugar phosphate isomerase/epimerase
MKLAYPIGTSDTRGPMLAYTGRLPDMLTAIKQIGYTGIEPFVRNPDEMDLSEFSKWVEKLGLEVAAVGTGPVAGEDKLTFTAKEPEIRRAAVERTKAVVRFAAAFDSQVNIGKLRGVIHAGLEAQSWQWMKDALLEVCEYAAKHQVQVTLEPQNQFVINNLNSTRQALDFLQEVGSGQLFLMLDLFHMHIEDKSVAASLIEAREVTLHAHFADSNRLVPGQGNMNYTEIIRVMKALKYDRYITIEANQSPDCRTAAEQAYSYIHALIREA